MDQTCKRSTSGRLPTSPLKPVFVVLIGRDIRSSSVPGASEWDLCPEHTLPGKRPPPPPLRLPVLHHPRNSGRLLPHARGSAPNAVAMLLVTGRYRRVALVFLRCRQARGQMPRLMGRDGHTGGQKAGAAAPSSSARSSFRSCSCVVRALRGLWTIKRRSPQIGL